MSRGGVQAVGQGRGLEGRLRERAKPGRWPGCVGHITREVWKREVQGNRVVDRQMVGWKRALGFRGVQGARHEGTPYEGSLAKTSRQGSDRVGLSVEGKSDGVIRQ